MPGRPGEGGRNVETVLVAACYSVSLGKGGARGGRGNGEVRPFLRSSCLTAHRERGETEKW